MDVFQHPDFDNHEQVVFCHDRSAGLRAIIAIHDTTLGPALGGCRTWDYPSEAEALRDVLRLARAMTCKAALAGLDMGGGKAVIIAPPDAPREPLFRAFGRFVASLGGRFVTGEEMGTTVADLHNIRRETRWVAGADVPGDQPGSNADATAWGVFHGIRACLEVVFGSPDPRGRRVSVQGVGNVGRWLAHYLSEAGAEITCADVNRRRARAVAERLGARDVAPEALLQEPSDVFAPCAIGGVINRHTIPDLNTRIVAGSANGPLFDEKADCRALEEHDILYAPDFAINAGALIRVDAEMRGRPISRVLEDTARVFDSVKEIMDLAQREGLSTVDAATLRAEQRIRAVAGVKELYLGSR